MARQFATDDVRVLHVTTPGTMGLVARYLAARLHLPLVGSVHTELVTELDAAGGPAQRGALIAYRRWIYADCNPLLVHTDEMRMRLTRAGWDRSRLVPWPAGVNVDRFSPARRSSGLRDSWGVSDRRLAVLYVGQLSPQKGLARLAAVEGLLRQRQLGARLIVVGDSGMTRGFRDRCGDAVFMGRMPHDEVAIAMASADVLVCPSDRDTTGHVVLEAQASGLPVIVSRYGASREQMIDGETGFVCDADEPLDFGLRTAQLVSDPQRRRRMSFAARAYAQTRPWTRALEPLFECYREADRSVQDSRRAAWWRRLGLGLRVR